MKRYVLAISLLSAFLGSCQKESPGEIRPLPFIKAGETINNKLQEQSINKLLEAYKECEVINGLNVCGIKAGDYAMDMDNNGKKDIFFSSILHSTGFNWAGKEVWISHAENFNLCPTPLKEGDRIDNSLTWSPNTMVNQPNTLVLSYKNGAFNNKTPMEKNEWAEKAYLAVRYKNGAETLFGWIELKIDDFNKINLYRFAFQRK